MYAINNGSITVDLEKEVLLDLSFQNSNEVISLLFFYFLCVWELLNIDKKLTPDTKSAGVIYNIQSFSYNLNSL